MNIDSGLSFLNDAQKQAVSAPVGHQLILAGAGSGKTRVLVHRIAWLIDEIGARPSNILAVTFTNKAAGEMRARLETMLNFPATGMWVGTFHSLAHRLLRAHATDAGLPENFQILDSDDQLRLIKRTMREMNIDEEQNPPRQIQWFINEKKDKGLRPVDVASVANLADAVPLKVYEAYTERCERGGLVDFAELLLRSLELWQNNETLLAGYQERFPFILVDEFQDTNTVQYAWLRLIAGDSGFISAVGDDDQSIYGWRGAKIENIHNFQKDFPDATLITLEQNYRSTGNILAAANGLISHNDARLGKKLWTQDDMGEPIHVYNAFNELDEARFIVSRIQQQCDEGSARSDIAILYRSNAQSRVLEEALLQANIPYRVYGGLRFFERAEVKDALAYLRLIANRHDDGAFERVVNTPTRGLGDKTVSIVRAEALDKQISLWRAAQNLLQQGELSGRAGSALARFLDLIDSLSLDTAEMSLDKQTHHVIKNSGLIEHYEKEKGEKRLARLENLSELVNATKEFQSGEEELPPLQAFLSQVVLDAGERQAEEGEEAVQLMTLHSAKGLEFPIVFLAGVEEGTFPHQMSLSQLGRLEEERRLCYVGVTRAKQKLFITYAEQRRLHGKTAPRQRSRFLSEIPAQYTQEVRMRTQIRRPALASKPNHFARPAVQAKYRVGQRVIHEEYGEGTVLNYNGQGKQARVQIQFKTHGTKWIMANIPRLRALA